MLMMRSAIAQPRHLAAGLRVHPHRSRRCRPASTQKNTASTTASPMRSAGAAHLRLRLRRQVLLDVLVLDALELGARQQRHELPAERERLARPSAPRACPADEAVLERVGERHERLVVVGQRRLAEDDGELLGLDAARVRAEELVGEVGVVLARLARADALLLEAREATAARRSAGRCRGGGARGRG